MKLLAWMPNPDQIRRYVNPDPQARLIVGAIEAVQNQTMDREIYLSLLADRLDNLLKQEPDPQAALDRTVQLLKSENLLDRTPTMEQAGDCLILNNALMWERLYLMDIPGKLPPRIVTNNPEAQKIISETTLENWLNALTNRPSNPM